MDEKLIKVILAAYLHDIGKLLRRGGISRKKETYKVAHAQYVADFFIGEDYSPFWREVGLIASLHHAKDLYSFKKRDVFENSDEARQLAWLVYMADNISSMERVDEDELEISRYEHIKHAGLRTVFENIFANDKLSNVRSYIPSTLQETNFELTDKALSFEGAYFDTKVVGSVGDMRIKIGFEKLAYQFSEKLSEFAREYPQISAKQAKKLIYALDQLLQNYLSLVPSDAYKSIGDISLYDHTKTTVAIASVLYHSKVHHKVYKKIEGLSETKQVAKEKIILIAGDFPGIQKYLFNSLQTEKHLAKRLRMRSMTVQLLNEAVIEFLLDKLDLSRASVLMNAGGKFVILASPLVQEKFQKLKNSIMNFLTKEYGASLRFSLIWEELEVGDVFDISEDLRDTRGVFENLFAKLSRAKHQVYSEEQMKVLFTQPQIAGLELCPSCSQHYMQKTDEDTSCLYCQKEIEGGRLITQKNGLYLSYVSEGEFFFDYSWEKGKTDTLFMTFNDREYQDKELPTLSKSINTFIPHLADGGAKSFEQLLDNDRGYLTMIKGDIDNMGLILKYGFDYAEGKSIYSVSRLVQMSRMLELFFGKYMNDFLKSEFDHVYTVFSGGDDFVFIVPFQQRLKFIQKIYQIFGNFVAGNPYLHFSSAVSIFKVKTPFAQIDAQAEKLLHQAKLYAKSRLSGGDKIELQQREIVLYQPEFRRGVKKSDFNLVGNLSIEVLGKINSTLLYRWYVELVKMRELLVQEKVVRSEYVKIGSRLLYSITRNILDQQTKEAVLNLITPMTKITDSSIRLKLEDLLLKIVNHLYENR